MSLSSSLRSHSEYLTAFELEAWKAEETQRFREHLQAEESKFRAKWEQDCQSLETDRASQFLAKHKQLLALESRLRQKISELEQRESKLAQTESEISVKVGNSQTLLKRMQEEHSLGLKAQASSHAAEFSVLSEKLRLADLRTSENDRKLLDYANFENIKNDLNRKNIEISSLQSKISALSKSRDHFRSALLDILSNPPLSTSLVHQPPQAPSSSQPSNGSQTSYGNQGGQAAYGGQGSYDGQVRERNIRLQAEREALLQGGLCEEDDPLIRALDEEISRIE